MCGDLTSAAQRKPVSAGERAYFGARGRRAHQRCRVLGWPCRMDFSRLAAALIASRGSATSMSFYASSKDEHIFM